MTGKTLYLIDGHSLLYRSYYAIRQLATSQGFPTNGIYGFLQTLRKILADSRPGYLGVVFDTPGPKVRKEVYEAYKSHRKPMPEDLIPQIPKLKEVLKAYRIPVFENSRYEADDVLASLAKKSEAADFETVIVTTDKDLLQLVDRKTRIWHPVKEIALDEAAVRENFGAPPGRVVDVLSLMGDASDNVPGVPGVGEKTAKGLIEEFGSLDALLARLDEVRNVRVRELIRANLDKVEMSRRLVTVERDLDVEFDPAAFALGEPDRDELVRLFRELEFTSLLAEHAREVPRTQRVYSAILEEKDLKALAARIRKAKVVSVDTETDSIYPTRARLVGMSFAFEPGEAFYLPLRHAYMGAPAQIPVEKALAILRPGLEDPKIRKIGQNIKYDKIVLRREGLALAGIDLDAMVLSYLLEPNWGKHSLDRQALAYLGLPSIPYAQVAGKGKAEVTMVRVPIETVVPYACQDADYALEICRLLWPRRCSRW